MYREWSLGLFNKGYNEVRKIIKYVKMSLITCDIVFCLMYIFSPFGLFQSKKRRGSGLRSALVL